MSKKYGTKTDHANALNEIVRQEFNLLRRLILDLALSDAAIAIATTASQVKTAAVLDYLIGGVFYTKAATDDFWTLTGSNVPDGYAQKWLLCVDAAGAASVVEATMAKAAADVVLPEIPDAKCVAGILTVENASGADFVPGTTLLSAADITDTYQDGPGADLVAEILPKARN